MDRRSFIRIEIAGAATGIIAPQIVLAGTLNKKISSNELAGGIFYTKQSPGRWQKKAGSHSPILEKTSSGIKVITGHPMKPTDHWIIKHILFDNDFKFIAENIFNPVKDKSVISNFKLKNHQEHFMH